MTQGAVVKNASDRGQVQTGKKKEKFERLQELEDIKRILATDYGRRFLWRLLKWTRVFESIWDQSSRIHYNAGVQDVGHFLTAEIVEANPSAYLTMMTESSKREESQQEQAVAETEPQE